MDVATVLGGDGAEAERTSSHLTERSGGTFKALDTIVTTCGQGPRWLSLQVQDQHLPPARNEEAAGFELARCPPSAIFLGSATTFRNSSQYGNKTQVQPSNNEGNKRSHHEKPVLRQRAGGDYPSLQGRLFVGSHIHCTGTQYDTCFMDPPPLIGPRSSSKVKRLAWVTPRTVENSPPE